MKKFIYCLLIFIMLPVITIAGTPAQELQSILTNTRSLQANFQQILFDNAGQKLQSSSGSMSVQRPEKFRWEIKKPDRQLLIADGTLLWNYDVGLEQVIVQKLKKRLGSTPALLLSGSAEGLLKEYNVERKNSDWFILKPKQADSQFQLIKLRFKEKQLQQMQLIDSLGQTSKLTFSQVKLNPKLKASLFKFKPPKGVDVIRN